MNQDNPLNPAVRASLHKRRSRRKLTIDHIRWFLVIWMAVLTLLIFLAYFYAKDIRILFAGTIAASTVGVIYPYYFDRRQRRQ